MRMDRAIAVVSTAILTVGLSRPVVAELCEKCRGQAYVLNVGVCTSCGGETRSGAFKLCRAYSDEQGKCEDCLALLDTAKQPPEKQPPKPEPIDPKKSGTYSFGKWKYRLSITAPGTRSEGKRGELSYDGQKLPAAELNDHYRTPWGLIYWVGDPEMIWGLHGWMPAPSEQAERKGKLLSPPEAQDVQLTAADNGKTVTAVVGKTIVISLEGNITTGYGWQIAEVKGKAVESLGKPSYATRPHQPGMVGVGGTFTLKFKAAEPGTAALKLVYVRPWEKDKPPEKTFAVTIKVTPEPKKVKPDAEKVKITPKLKLIRKLPVLQRELPRQELKEENSGSEPDSGSGGSF
jgi:inhibitor of cysteine peptidase